MTARPQAKVEELPRRKQATQRLDVVFDMPLSSIDASDRRFQMRLHTSTADVEASIRKHGQQVPITLWGRTPHIIIDGFRRVQALATLGHTSVKAILRDDLGEQAAFRLAFIENVKRRSWTPYERALAIRRAVETRGIHCKDVAEELSLSERQVQRYLQMTEFDARLAEAVSDGRISMGHAAVIHRAEVEDMDEAIRLAQELPLSSLKRRIAPPRRGRPRSYFRVSGQGFLMPSLHFRPGMADGEKTRMLAALERAVTVVKASM